MGTIFLLINTFLPIVISELQQYKVLSPQVGGLITGIEGAATAFGTEITTNSGAVSITGTSILAAISAAIQVLQTQTTLNPTTLAIIGALDKAVAAGLAAINITAVDYTKLHLEAPNA